MDSSKRLTDQECEEIARLLGEAWRIRCPNGHSRLTDTDGPTVYCGMCNEGYHYADLVDAQESNPVIVAPPGYRHR